MELKNKLIKTLETFKDPRLDKGLIPALKNSNDELRDEIKSKGITEDDVIAALIYALLDARPDLKSPAKSKLIDLFEQLNFSYEGLSTALGITKLAPKKRK